MEFLKVKKVFGCDFIFLFVLKVGVEVIVIFFITLFNRCIMESKWLQLWKKGEWVLVFKSDDFLLKENYRFVIVFLVVDKVFEQIVVK